MIAVLALEWRRLFATPRGWVLLSLVALVTAWRFLSGIDQALFALEQQTELKVSVTRAVVLPVLAQTAVLVAFLAGLMAGRLWAADRARGTDRLWLSAPLRPMKVVLGQWSATAGILMLVVLLAVVIASSAWLGAPIDLPTVLAGVLGLALLAAFAAALAGAVSALAASPMLAAFFTLLVLLGLWAPDAAPLARGAGSTLLSWVSISRRLHSFLNGEVAAAHVGFLVAGTVIGLVSWTALIALGRSWSRLLYVVVAMVLAVGAVVGLERADWRWDWTRAQRHTLSSQTRQLLSSLEGEITVIAPVAEGVPRSAITAFFDRIRRHYPELELEWIDPGSEPERSRALALEPGEMLIRLGDRETRLRSLSESELVHALGQIVRPSGFRIAYASGGGERDLRGEANHHWGRFGAELAESGMTVVPLDWVVTPVVPDDLDLLIVAAGDGAPVPGTAPAIVDYLAGGGRLWWLADPGAAQHYPELVRYLALEQLPGTVIDTRGADRGIDDPRFLLVPRYPDHPLSRDVRQPTLFPIAAAWLAEEDGGWQAASLVESGPASWNEVGTIAGAVQPEAADERRGPLDIALALERENARVVVVGDGDFLSNRFLGNGGNVELGLRMVRWLLAEDEITIPVRDDPDRHLALSPRQVGFLGLLWLVALPGLLLLIAGWRWWRRRA